jgi:hypothetical protein
LVLEVGTTLAEEFKRQAEAVLAAYPDVPRQWSVEGDAIRLTLPPLDRDGFSIEIVGGVDYLNLFAGGAHEVFDLRTDSAPEVAARVLGCVRDLLSPDMQLRELAAGGRPYRWIIEARAAEGWHPEIETGLLFFNYFGERTERIYQNRQLSGRLVAAS